jgi:FAD/FMN-containing dehydrogenase
MGMYFDTWVTEMEIVTADESIVRASNTENLDLFRAARGSAQGSFGVVTRIKSRTIPARKVFETTSLFNCTAASMNFLHESLKRTRKPRR